MESQLSTSNFRLLTSSLVYKKSLYKNSINDSMIQVIQISVEFKVIRGTIDSSVAIQVLHGRHIAWQDNENYLH